MAMLPAMLEDDRRRSGWPVAKAAWRRGVSVREYREIEAGERRAELGDVPPDLQAVRLAADVRDGSVAAVVQRRRRVLLSDWWSLQAGVRHVWRDPARHVVGAAVTLEVEASREASV